MPKYFEQRWNRVGSARPAPEGELASLDPTETPTVINDVELEARRAALVTRVVGSMQRILQRRMQSRETLSQQIREALGEHGPATDVARGSQGEDR